MGKVVKGEKIIINDDIWKSVYERDGESYSKSGAKLKNNDWTREIWYQGKKQIFTDEEIAESDKEFRRINRKAMKEIEADGYIRFPIYFHNVDGELKELEAWIPPTFEPSCTEGFFEKHGMKTNIYIPSYGRAGVAKTVKYFDEYGIKNYYICVDPEQYSKYKEHYPRERILIRDIEFRRPEFVEPYSSLKRPMNMAGHAPLCNFTLALSRTLGESHFTFSDDDFLNFAMKAYKKDGVFNSAVEPYDKENFYRCSNIKVEYGFDFRKFWNGLEEIAMKTRNAGFVGLERFGTVFNMPLCFKMGTRVYSFYISSNDTQINHVGFQNNDVITSIELSKHGLVNHLFEGICYNSEATQSSGGGQTELYQRFGTLDKGKILVRAEPNITQITERYSRIHHLGDYGTYRNLRPVPRAITEKE